MTTVILKEQAIEVIDIKSDDLLRTGVAQQKAQMLLDNAKANLWASIAYFAHTEGEAALTAWWDTFQTLVKEQYNVKNAKDVPGVKALSSNVSTAKKAFKLGITLAEFDGTSYVITPKSEIKEDKALIDTLVAVCVKAGKDGLSMADIEAAIRGLNTERALDIIKSEIAK